MQGNHHYAADAASSISEHDEWRDAAANSDPESTHDIITGSGVDSVAQQWMPERTLRTQHDSYLDLTTIQYLPSLRSDVSSASYHDWPSIMPAGSSDTNAQLYTDASQAFPRTPLQAAVSQALVQSVQKLLQCGADANTPDSHGTTALHICAKTGSDEHCMIARLLVACGALLDLPDHSNRTPLLIAIENCNENIVNVFLDLGACAQ
jgi:hypothetical protein